MIGRLFGAPVASHNDDKEAFARSPSLFLSLSLSAAYVY